jgi:hypothetical protein
MTIPIPAELEQALLLRAQQRQISVESLVNEALAWYLQMEPATLDELTAWQEVRDEALRLVEESPT